MTKSMDETEVDVRRVPIVLGEHAIALLTLFTKRYDNLDDTWAWDWLHEEVHAQHQKSAKQFILAMEGYWSPAFLMALRSEITHTLAEHDKKYGTKFAERTVAK